MIKQHLKYKLIQLKKQSGMLTPRKALGGTASAFTLNSLVLAEQHYLLWQVSLRVHLTSEL